MVDGMCIGVDVSTNSKAMLDKAWDRLVAAETDVANLIRARDALNLQVVDAERHCKDAEKEWLNMAQGNWA